MRKFFLLVLSLFGVMASAQVSSSLRMPADLVLHPRELQSVLRFTEAQVHNQSDWIWPEMQFTSPYKTDWSQVQAVGPIELRFDTRDLSQGGLDFELSWRNPWLQIGRFHLNDKIVIQSGSVRIISHIEGQCEFMQFKIPEGDWRVKGRMRLNSAFEPSVEKLELTANTNVEAKIDMGKCDGQKVVIDTLYQTLTKFATQKDWAQSVISSALQSLVKSSFQDLEIELLKARLIPSFVKDLDLRWQPHGIARLNSGAWRVAGELKAISHHHSALGVEDKSISSPLDVGVMEALKSSSFVLPKDSLATLLKFAARFGHGRHRSTSADWPQVRDLMQNRFFQFFLWPDLLNFKRDTQFYFDVMTSNRPQLSEPQSTAEGLKMSISAPLKTLQWAPHQKDFVPYFEFDTRLKGVIDMSVEDESLRVKIQPKAFDVNAKPRAEFQAVRYVHPRISTSIMGAAIQQSVFNRSYQVLLPKWKLNEQLHFGVESLNVQGETLLLPLQIKSSK